MNHLQPFVSPLINEDCNPGNSSFGFTWQAAARPVAGFRIDTSWDGICEVVNLGLEQCNDLVETSTVRYFILLPDEHVIQVDVIGNPMGFIQALRFISNLRTSAWYGSTGSSVSKSFVAPDGFCVKLLRGTFGKKKCVRLGVLYSPLAMELRGLDPPGRIEHEPTQLFGDQENTFPFDSHKPSLKALVVDFGEFVRSIDVLSTAEYNYYGTISAFVNFDVNEHFFVMVHGEYLCAVEICVADSKLVSIRFKTNRRTSQWYGGGEGTRRIIEAMSPGLTICGFYGNRGGYGIAGLGLVLFHPEDGGASADYELITSQEE